MSRGLPRWFDLAVAAAVLVAGAPVWLVVGAAVGLSSPGPVLHRSRRVGLRGREFELLKFRTMYMVPGGGAVTAARDDRITPVGRLLRKAKLDEVPQLLNVLRGEMALVGPRPEDPRYVAVYTVEQRAVLQARPGLTSPASVRYIDEEELLAAADDVERFYVEEVMPAKLRIDIAWLRDRTVRSDLRLLVQTLVVITTARKTGRRAKQ